MNNIKEIFSKIKDVLAQSRKVELNNEIKRREELEGRKLNQEEIKNIIEEINNTILEELKTVASELIFNKQNIALLLSTTLAIGAVGCTNEAKTNGQTEVVDDEKDKVEYSSKISFENYEASSEYINKEDIFAGYSYIAKKLENKDNLTNEEILKISNIYKNVISSIEYLEMYEGYGVIDELPEMEGLYTDIKSTLIELISDKSLLVTPDNKDVDFTNLIEDYLIRTEQIPLQDIKIMQLQDDGSYCIATEKGKMFFQVYATEGENATLSILYRNYVPHIQEMVPHGISLTQSEEEIPVIDGATLGDTER